MSMQTKTRRVKTHRNTSRPTTRFGSGLTPYVPDAGRMPYTAADLAWAAQAFEDEDTALEARYAESAMLDRYQAGYCC
jgi:hypothetical protein